MSPRTEVESSPVCGTDREGLRRGPYVTSDVSRERRRVSSLPDSPQNPRVLVRITPITEKIPLQKRYLTLPQKSVDSKRPLAHCRFSHVRGRYQ